MFLRTPDRLNTFPTPEFDVWDPTEKNFGPPPDEKFLQFFFSIQKNVFFLGSWMVFGPPGPLWTLWDPLLQAILAQNAHKMATLGPKNGQKKREKIGGNCSKSFPEGF